MSKRKVNPKKVGERIREVRGSLTQEKFYKVLGLKRQSDLSRYERGRIPPPDLLVRISDHGGVSIDWLLTGEEAQRQQAEKVA